MSLLQRDNPTKLWRGTEGGSPKEEGAGGGERQERRGQGGGFPKWQEMREKEKNFAILHITFYKRNRAKRREPLRKGAESRDKRNGRLKFQTPLSPLTELRLNLSFLIKFQ